MASNFYLINNKFILMDVVYQKSIQLALKIQTPFMFALKHLENINKPRDTYLLSLKNYIFCDYFVMSSFSHFYLK